MTYPKLDLPPLSQFPGNYQYPIVLGTGQSGGILGNRIIADYEEGRRCTPEQKKRWIAITIVAVTTIAAVTLTIVAYTVTMMPLLYGAIPLFVIGLGVGIWYLATKKPDLDSPGERAEVRQEFLRLSFAELMQKQDIATIVGYQLLDAIPIHDQRRLFYTHIAGLGEAHNRIKSTYEGDLATVVNTYATGTALIENWRRDQELIIRQRNALYDVGTAPLRSRRNTQHPAGTALAIVAGGGSIALHVQGQMTIDSINRHYGSEMRPWKDWISAERNTLRNAFQRALGNIEHRYQTILQNA